MVALLVLFIVVVGMAVGVRWIANLAEARVRSQMGWGLVAAFAFLLAYGIGDVVVAWLWTAVDDNVAVMMLSAVVPFVLAGLAVASVGTVLGGLGIRAVAERVYQVHCRENGAGKLEITPEVVRLQWENRSQNIARAQLQAVSVDGECLRVRWTEGELLLLPMMQPQTREGRIHQSHALARILSPAIPLAIQVDRNASSA